MTGFVDACKKGYGVGGRRQVTGQGEKICCHQAMAVLADQDHACCLGKPPVTPKVWIAKRMG